MNKILENSLKKIKDFINNLKIKIIYLFNETQKQVKTFRIFDFLLLISIIIIAIILPIIFKTGDNAIMIICSVSGCVSAVLSAKGRVSNYYFGLIQSCLYATICFQLGMTFQFIIYLFINVPFIFYGIHSWSKNINNENYFVAPRKMTRINYIIFITFLILLLIIAIFINGVILPENHGQIIFNKFLLMGSFDIVISILSIIALYLCINRYTEQWTLWLVLDVLLVIQWSLKFSFEDVGLSNIIMYSTYFMTSSYGMFCWKKEYNKKKEISKIN